MNKISPLRTWAGVFPQPPTHRIFLHIELPVRYLTPSRCFCPLLHNVSHLCLASRPLGFSFPPSPSPASDLLPSFICACIAQYAAYLKTTLHHLALSASSHMYPFEVPCKHLEISRWSVGAIIFEVVCFVRSTGVVGLKFSASGYDSECPSSDRRWTRCFRYWLTQHLLFDISSVSFILLTEPVSISRRFLVFKDSMGTPLPPRR